ncbi:MAG: aldehyde dehydrogenase family protein, partial [Hyphomicrobiaceae bacterium]
RRFLRYAADSNLKKTVLECGGKNPAVVLSDAEDLDLVAEHVVNAAFWNMGENCSANSRLIVHKDLKAPLLERMIARVRDWKTGDPLEPSNHLGALIDAEHCQKVAGYIAGAGSAPVVGGTVDGNFIAPTIFDNVDTDNAIAREEVFGPLLAVITAGTDDEAIRIANDTAYGLTASVFTANAKKALRAARELKAGTVTVNCYGEGDIATPFGGYKQSGFGGRDNSLHAHDQFTEVKTIWLDLSDPASGDLVQ